MIICDLKGSRRLYIQVKQFICYSASKKLVCLVGQTAETANSEENMDFRKTLAHKIDAKFQNPGGTQLVGSSKGLES